ncbi:MAG: patatin-like phospholipase family protein [Gammaproteobacteria bacterium]|nr:patatin-like phospholipase family protein [Gammaproteobacteria bacterium]
MRKIAFCILLTVILSPLSVMAELLKDDERTKIGLVLSGGGARGAAHIGVIRRLEELRIPVDYIAGTSMGAIIGGLYATGMDSAEIEQVLTSIDFEDAFQDKTQRSERSFRRKLDDDLYLFKARLGLSDEGEFKLPEGLVQGQKIDLIMKKITISATKIKDFDNLPIPYRAVASDMVTGTEVVLGEGNLATAMRASMNLPSIMAPLEYEDKLLADGGIVNNLPIDVARNMGADVVIAVDISSPLLQERKQLSNVLKITDQLIGFMTRGNTEKQIKTLTPDDVFIVPKLGDIGSGDFDQTSGAIPLGYAAADVMTTELRKYSLSTVDYDKHLAGRKKPNIELPKVDFVRLDNQSDVDDEVITSKISLKPGDTLDIARLESDIGHVYGLDIFNNVTYEIIEEDNKTGVVVHAEERSWGPNYLQFGLELSDNMEGDNSYNLGVAYTRTEMNRLNGEWRTALQVGEDPLILTEIYQPLDVEQRYFINIGAFASHRNTNVFQNTGQQLAEYRVKSGGLRLAGGRNLGNWGEFRIGYEYESGSADARIGAPLLPDFDFDDAALFARFSIDTMDNRNFPNDGQHGVFQYNNHRDSMGGDFDYEQLTANYSIARTWGDNTLIGSIRYDTTVDDDAPIQGLFRAGGFLDLSGFNQGELTGQHVGVMKAIYMREIEEMFLLKAYLGASLEYGGVWQERGDIFDDNIAAGSVFLGLDTPIGPVYTGYGYAEGGHDSVYVFMGTLF